MNNEEKFLEIVNTIIQNSNQSSSKIRESILKIMNDCLNDDDDEIRALGMDLLKSITSQDMERYSREESLNRQLSEFMKYKLLKSVENENQLGNILCKSIIDERPANSNDDDVDIIKTSGHGSESLEKLRAQKEKVRLERVGLFSGINFSHISDEHIKWAVAQALIDNIQTVEYGLCVRDIFPDIDFLRGNGDPINNRSWLVTTECVKEKLVFKTNKNCDNERKIYFINGFQLLSDNNPVNSVIIKRSDVKTIDIVQVQHLCRKGDFAFLKTPIMYKRGDNMNIEFVFNSDGYNSVELRPMGCVVEALGARVCG